MTLLEELRFAARVLSAIATNVRTTAQAALRGEGQPAILPRAPGCPTEKIGCEYRTVDEVGAERVGETRTIVYYFCDTEPQPRDGAPRRGCRVDLGG